VVCPNAGAPCLACFARRGRLQTHHSKNFVAPRPGELATSILPQNGRPHYCGRAAPQQMLALPWKSGVSAPRQASKRNRASAPVDVFTAGTGCVRSCRSPKKRNPTSHARTAPKETGQSDTNEDDGSKQNHHGPAHHRGRTALQRRVKALKKEPGFSSRVRFHDHDPTTPHQKKLLSFRTRLIRPRAC
jgi:hypothetical protein